jgi:hypothetical protein
LWATAGWSEDSSYGDYDEQDTESEKYYSSYGDTEKQDTNSEKYDGAEKDPVDGDEEDYDIFKRWVEMQEGGYATFFSRVSKRSYRGKRPAADYKREQHLECAMGRRPARGDEDDAWARGDSVATLSADTETGFYVKWAGSGRYDYIPLAGQKDSRKQGVISQSDPGSTRTPSPTSCPPPPASSTGWTDEETATPPRRGTRNGDAAGERREGRAPHAAVAWKLAGTRMELPPPPPPPLAVRDVSSPTPCTTSHGRSAQNKEALQRRNRTSGLTQQQRASQTDWARAKATCTIFDMGNEQKWRQNNRQQWKQKCATTQEQASSSSDGR